MAANSMAGRAQSRKSAWKAWGRYLAPMEEVGGALILLASQGRYGVVVASTCVLRGSDSQRACCGTAEHARSGKGSRTATKR